MILGLSGIARSGKDTVGNYLVEHHGFKKLAFADRMREMAFAIDPVVAYDKFQIQTLGNEEVSTAVIPVHFMELVNNVGYDESKDNPEVRRFLQRLGTEAGRNIWGDDFWTNVVRDKIIHEGRFDRWVITDTRFRNEAECVKDMQGYVVRIERTGIEAPNAHISERDLAEWNFDYFLKNDGSLDELYHAVDEMMSFSGDPKVQSWVNPNPSAGRVKARSISHAN
jgi:hypothetical protein